VAVAKTGAMFKALSFDGYSSRNYGVYITGEAVYNAPERAVEMISIPNRNGAFALDQGHFENIEVTYPAGVFADNEEDFAEAISNFRNLLCSRKGYCTLTDEYHPDEYREAVYKSGLEVDPTQLRAGEFNITFECKPQRFLNSGSTKVTVANNGTITNPTLFDAKPQLQVTGYGDININNDVISIQDAEIGKVLLCSETSISGGYTFSYFDSTNMAYLNTGDSIIVNEGSVFEFGIIGANFPTTTVTALNMTVSGDFNVNITNVPAPTGSLNNYYRTIKATVTDGITFQKGTSVNKTITFAVTATLKTNNTTSSYTGTMTITIEYHSGNPGYIRTAISSYSPSLPTGFNRYIPQDNSKVAQIDGYSTKKMTNDPFFIDLDIGEAYADNNGDITNLNNIVTLPAKLPTLPPGSTTITYDNTVTSFKITPRWWKI